jgi:hypothetical protein
MKNKPSLFKGDYYTEAEYKQLIDLSKGNKDFLSTYLNTVLCEKGFKIKNNLKWLDKTFSFHLYKLMFDMPLNEVPLYINDEALKTICQWRFQINK